MNSADLLQDAVWHCWAGTEPAGESSGYPALVPGTVAAALRAAGESINARDFDAEQWSYRAVFDAPAGTFRLDLAGLATIADVWLDDLHLLHSENMFQRHRVTVEFDQPAEHELRLRFSDLASTLADRRPRPRWKVRRLPSQNLRWVRTTLLGRLIGWPETPAPVGPWRPITLKPEPAIDVITSNLITGTDGAVDVQLELSGRAGAVTVDIGGHRAELAVDGTYATGHLFVPNPQLWWPHTHGAPKLYEVTVEVDGSVVWLGNVAFRSVVADSADGGMTLVVNGAPIFCRGAYWMPLDPVGLVDSDDDLRAALTQFRDAGLNLVRTGGETVYPSPQFLELCDELGLLIWHDCMFAFVDVPDDADLNVSIETELRQQFEQLQGHPSVAVISGGSEIDQQAAMMGLSATGSANPLFLERLRSLAAELLGDVPVVASSPSGGDLPIEPRSGIAHYYGVGAYLRDLDDARRAGVRFAAECLAFGTPPERQTIEAVFGSASVAGHHPLWKAAVYRDAGAPWDFEDVVTHYVQRLFGIDPLTVRYADPDRYLDLARATVAELFISTLSEWRRVGSPCAGAVVFYYRDLRAGAGLGVVDSLGRPKASWYALKEVCAPVAVLVTDEGLNGLDAHVFNDTGQPLAAELLVELFANGEVRVEQAGRELKLDAHTAETVALAGLFDGFRDLSYAYRFGPPSFDVVVVSLIGPAGEVLSRQCHLPDGLVRAREHDLGLHANVASNDGGWQLTVGTRRFAQRVSIDVAGFTPAENWFNLAPGETRLVNLVADGSKASPRGDVLALNGAGPTRVAS